MKFGFFFFPLLFFCVCVFFFFPFAYVEAKPTKRLRVSEDGSGVGGQLGNSQEHPSWQHGSGDWEKFDMKKSADVLGGRRLSGDGEEELFPPSGGWDVGQVDLSQEADIAADQISSFLRIADDQMRSRAMGKVINLLKAKIAERDEAFLNKCAATVVRLSVQSAFVSVRGAFSEVTDLMRAAKFTNVTIPDGDVVSRWVPAEQLPSVLSSSENGELLVSRLLRSINVMEGRIPHVVTVLAWHPTFLEKWYRSMMMLMRGPGPLPFTWRRFISIVACARFHCLPMLKLQELDFLGSGGPPEWVEKGISAPSLPSKLHALLELNAMLAHQPWRITAKQMEGLLGLSKSKDSTWSIGELVHAMAIMVTFHSICGVVWGLGVTAELDIERSLLDAHSHVDAEAVATVASGGTPNESTTQLIGLLKQGPKNFSQQRQSWLEAKTDQKAAVWAQTEEKAASSESLLLLKSASTLKTQALEYSAKYIGQYIMEYVDFDVNATVPLNKAQFSWADNGYSVIHQVVEGLAPLLESELQLIRSLTYESFADHGSVDTTSFREAIWQYAHRIKGLLDDDYNYAEVNVLLNRQVKYFVKKITCFPATITLQDYLGLGLGLHPSEKCHVALLATEASKEAALTYALRALYEWHAAKE